MATPNQAPEPMFDSLEEERAYHASKAEQFKNRLNQQVSDIKADTTAKVKTGLIWGGAFLACYGVMRLLSSTKKHIVDSTHGPMRVSEKESVLWTAAKGAALLGLGYVAKDSLLAMLDKHTADEPNPDLGDDTTEL